MNNPAPRPSRRVALALTPRQADELRLLWSEHAAPLQAMLRRWCGNDGDAADALQELFLRLARTPHLVLSAENPRALLVVTARRIAIDAARRRQAGQRREEQLAESGTLTELGADARSDADLRAAIARAVRALAPEQRHVFEARFFQGLTLAEIAEAQAISINTAASRFRYALDKIRAELRPYYDDMNKTQSTSPVSAPASTPVAADQARLIRALEPKRVPSVAPGLEGLAALAPDDAHFESQVIENVEHGIDEALLPEVSNCEGMDGGLIAIDEEFVVEKVDEGVSVEEFIGDVGSVDDLTVGEPLDPEWLDQIEPEIAICTLFGEFGPSGEGMPEISQCWFENMEVSEPHLEDFFTFGGDDSTHDGSGDEVVTDGEDQTAEDVYQPNVEELFKDYQVFLGDNPDWLTENGIGDIQAQVMTPSIYFAELELENPGAAQGFDLWYAANYLQAVDGGVVVKDVVVMDGVVVDEIAYNNVAIDRGATVGVIQPNFRGEVSEADDAPEIVAGPAIVASGASPVVSSLEADAHGSVGHDMSEFTGFESITLDVPAPVSDAVAGLAAEPAAVGGFVFTNLVLETPADVTAIHQAGDVSATEMPASFVPAMQAPAGLDAVVRQDTVGAVAQPEAVAGLAASSVAGFTPQAVAANVAVVAGIGAMVAPSLLKKRVPSASR